MYPFTKKKHPFQFDIYCSTILKSTMVYSFNCNVHKPELIFIKSRDNPGFIVWNPKDYIDKEKRCLESGNLQKLGDNNILVAPNETGDVTTICIALPCMLKAGDEIFVYIFGSELLNDPEYFTTKEKEELFGSYLVGSAGKPKVQIWVKGTNQTYEGDSIDETMLSYYRNQVEDTKVKLGWQPSEYTLKTSKGYITVPTEVIRQDRLQEYITEQVAELSDKLLKIEAVLKFK